MIIDTTAYGKTLLRADEGKALCPVGQSGPSSTTVVYLADGASPESWKDCDYLAEQDSTEDNQ